MGDDEFTVYKLKRKNLNDKWGFKLTTLDTNETYITEVYEDTPAEKAGLEKGLCVLSINHIPTISVPHDFVCHLIQKAERTISIKTKPFADKTDGTSKSYKNKKSYNHDIDLKTNPLKQVRNEDEWSSRKVRSMKNSVLVNCCTEDKNRRIESKTEGNKPKLSSRSVEEEKKTELKLDPGPKQEKPLTAVDYQEGSGDAQSQISQKKKIKKLSEKETVEAEIGKTEELCLQSIGLEDSTPPKEREQKKRKSRSKDDIKKKEKNTQKERNITELKTANQSEVESDLPVISSLAPYSFPSLDDLKASIPSGRRRELLLYSQSSLEDRRKELNAL